MHANLYYKLNKESKQHTYIDKKIKVPLFIWKYTLAFDN